MVGAHVKGETLKLIERREALEGEMNAIIARLTAPGAPGLSGNLLDAEGFPRADVDVPAIRADRNRLAVLRTDYKEVTQKIEQNLHVLHSVHGLRDSSTLPQKRTAEGQELRQSRPADLDMEGSPSQGPTPMEEDTRRVIPFAVVDEIFEGSPAAIDGLMLEDQIVKFGSVEGGDDLLPRLAQEAQANQDRPVFVVVIRRGLQLGLVITPRPWSGRGLLGCHIQRLAN